MISSRAESAWSLVKSPIGRFKLKRMFQNGLQPELRVPLEFLLGAKLSPEDRLMAERIEAIRSGFLKNSEPYSLLYSPPKTGSPYARLLPLSWLARTASVPRYWGTFLYLCANAFRARTILEFGACLGISGSYLAASQSCERLYSMEGSPELAVIARSTFDKTSQKVILLNSYFDEALDRLLPQMHDGIDLAFIDGHHERDATIGYLERLKPFLTRHSLLVFDDIQWSSEMEEAWQIICRQPSIGCAIHLGRFGVCVWDPGAQSARIFDLSSYTRLWHKGKPKYDIVQTEK